MKKKIFFHSLFLLFLALPGMACESCALVTAGKNISAAEAAGNWHAGFTFEQQNWDELPAREAHQLHHRGHHFHDKTHEEFYHVVAGQEWSDRFSLTVDVPYVVRGSIEIDDHARLGAKETSEGLGDTLMLATYKWRIADRDFFAAVAGLKLPTGSTSVENSQGVLFDSELQPGTGSWDFPLGVSFERHFPYFVLSGNALYAVKTEGRRGFEPGDLFSTAFFFDFPMGRNWSPGFYLNFQHETKQRESGVSISDSGGDTLLAGPSLRFQPHKNWELFAGFALPVYQNLDGVHQELDFVWDAGMKVSWG